ncbi:hypothetical protein [Listeria immobilis]|uniref:hypothetical protein n=1 Tax=Listeria immobilis TaxID=2713502 RepID=UPI001FE5E055|nr:hypothetical protein [Listeria immobilis]
MTYKDRGIKKWQGFFLSEHSEQMEQQQAKSLLKWREPMTPDCIEHVLSNAISHQSMLVIQQKPLDADAFPEPDIVGRVAGVDDGTVFIQSASEVIAIPFSNILHVEERTIDKWYR